MSSPPPALLVGVPGAQAPVLVRRFPAAEEDVLIVVGEADLGTADRLGEQLLAHLAFVRRVPVRVELCRLTFCDTRGLDALQRAARAARAAGLTLTFSGMSAQLTWLYDTFPARDPAPPG